MKKHFLTGLVILLPVTLTVLVVVFVFNLLTEPFLGISQAFLTRYHLFQHGFFFFSPEQVQLLISKFLILLVLFLATVSLGLAARWVFFHYVIKFWEALVARIPLVNSVYRACNDVIRTIFGSKTSGYSIDRHRGALEPLPFGHDEDPFFRRGAAEDARDLQDCAGGATGGISIM